MRLLLLIALTMCAFAANSLLNRAALSGGVDAALMGPAGFALIRLASGAAMLWLLARGRAASALRMPMKTPITPMTPMTLRARGVGAVTLAVYVLGFSFAYLTLEAGTGALILFGAVQLTMLAGALLGGEHVPPRRWLGAALAFCGVVVLSAPGAVGRPDVTGVLLMAAAGCGWGIYSLNGRRAGDPLAATAVNFLLALPFALIAALMLPDWDRASLPGIALAVVSGAVTSGLGYALWYSVLPQLPAAVAAVAQLSVPVIAAIGGAALLGEAPGLRFWLAAVLVIGGVLLSLRRRPS